MAISQKETARMVIEFITGNQGNPKEPIMADLNFTESQLRHSVRLLEPEKKLKIFRHKSRNYYYTPEYYDANEAAIIARFTKGEVRGGGEKAINDHINLINSLWPRTA